MNRTAAAEAGCDASIMDGFSLRVSSRKSPSQILGQWVRHRHHTQLDNLERVLLDPRTVDRKHLKTDLVNRLFAEHRDGRRDHGNRMWETSQPGTLGKILPGKRADRERVSAVENSRGVTMKSD